MVHLCLRGKAVPTNTIHSTTNVHNQKTDTTVLTNVHGSGAVLSPADHVVVNYSDEEHEHLPRTNDHEVAQAE